MSGIYKGGWLLAGCALFFVMGTSGQDREGVNRNEIRWRVMEPVVQENLSVFPLLADRVAGTAGFLTLDEGLASGEVVISETAGGVMRRTRDFDPATVLQEYGQGAQVNRLVLINRSQKRLLLLAGEVVTGGKQDRVIGKDRIVPPGAEPLPLDVFCVEHGRWSGASSQFAAANMILHPSVREKAALDRNQSEVWAAVRAGSSQRSGADASAPRTITPEALGAVIAREAQSESYVKILQSAHLGSQVERFAREFEDRFARATRRFRGEQLTGVVVAYGDEAAWADAFASPALFDQYWPKLLRSYAVEALARPRGKGHASLQDAQGFVRPLTGHETSESEAGVYLWRQITQGREAEIYLESLIGNRMVLHWCKVLRSK